MPLMIRSVGGQRVAVRPNSDGASHSITSLRDDLIEALRGLTIEFKLEISDVIANGDSSNNTNCESKSDNNDGGVGTSNDVSSVDEASGGLPQQQTFKSVESPRKPAIVDVTPPVGVKRDNVVEKESSPCQTPEIKDNGSIEPAKPEIGSSAAAIMDEAEMECQSPIFQNMKPKLVNEFRSNIRPISSLRPPSKEAQRTAVSFIPHQLLKKQAENKVQGKNSSQRKTFVDPLGLDLFRREIKRPAPVATAETIETPVVFREPQLPSKVETNSPERTVTIKESIPDVPKKLHNPAMIWGNVDVGSLIDTCKLYKNDDETFTYIARSQNAILEVTKLLNEKATEIEMLPTMRNPEFCDVVFAKSREDDSWYRAIVEEINGSELRLRYVDWGQTETIDSSRARHLSISTLSMAAIPSCAIKAEFTNALASLEPIFEGGFKAKVISYDEFDSLYKVTALV